MMTGNTGIIDRAKAKMVGATDYLTKPFSRSEFLEIFSKYSN
jgi:twitching motility two-component system response regulator PilG